MPTAPGSRGSAAHRRRFFVSVLLAAAVAGPLAAGVVAFAWAQGEPTALLGTATTPATWSARTFIAAFDILVLAMWPLAALVVSRVERRDV